MQKKIPAEISHPSLSVVWAMLPSRQSSSTNILMIGLNLSLKKEGRKKLSEAHGWAGLVVKSYLSSQNLFISEPRC